ncbi:AAA family ATPase [Nesterenkonia halotolerans]|uniref:ATP-dependent endonuclease of OLD family n=1 Tax=Nesterenkonia halotolerans TaxID=225325 RepID=A0ABR9J857_9MICC|nr:AAA family ATPase [Nesterenkonia halotolerans]MBE1515173.1 putative ATP-dependent endonuclease of OLD family [Nesterenkonia halotolerans]
MHIETIEIRNYRKLASVRLDLAAETTLLVGANNSGKTSALIALRSFLKQGISAFSKNDFTLSRWQEINDIGVGWTEAPDVTPAVKWDGLLPSLDVWLRVDDHDVHRVSALIPNLDWSGGLVGVRFSLEPKDEAELAHSFNEAWNATQTARAAWQASGRRESEGHLSLWPDNLVDFLTRRFQTHLTLRHYTLDPDQLQDPQQDRAVIQNLSADAQPLATNPLQDIVVVDEINAQRGFGDKSGASTDDSSGRIPETAKLSRQLSEYYTSHLDPTETPGPEDLDALQTITIAQNGFDARLQEAFREALKELTGLSYPGVTDPSIRVASKLSASESLKHESAVSFKLDNANDQETQDMFLPEGQNGLGYQNLISMIFRLMSFRDRWMRVGKARRPKSEKPIEPIHLVLVEEPEAHLHVQVQQVFAKKAFEVLRNHPDLQTGSQLTTQLVISTHSSHIAHELPFESLRYFRRLEAGTHGVAVPTSNVINVGTTFGTEPETQRFVTRYLRVQHADVFFADALILIEGSAERMLVPHFIQKHHAALHHAYVTMLEIGGSHAHRLRPLIDALKIPTLVVTDLDPKTKVGGNAPTQRGAAQITGNPTLVDWWEHSTVIDALLDTAPDRKLLELDGQYSVRFAYQTPVMVAVSSEEPEEALPSTFEDSLALSNLDFFKELEGTGLTKKIRDILNKETDATSIARSLHDALRTGSKAALAMDILVSTRFNSLEPPAYISEGLSWLEERVQKTDPALGGALHAA